MSGKLMHQKGRSRIDVAYVQACSLETAMRDRELFTGDPTVSLGVRYADGAPTEGNS